MPESILVEFKEHKRTIFFLSGGKIESYFLKIPKGVQIIYYKTLDDFAPPYGSGYNIKFEGMRAAFCDDDFYYPACLGNTSTCCTVCLAPEMFYRNLEELRKGVTANYWESFFTPAIPMFDSYYQMVDFLEEWAIVTKNNEDVYAFLKNRRKTFNCFSSESRPLWHII